MFKSELQPRFNGFLFYGPKSERARDSLTHSSSSFLEWNIRPRASERERGGKKRDPEIEERHMVEAKRGLPCNSFFRTNLEMCSFSNHQKRTPLNTRSFKRDHLA